MQTEGKAGENYFTKRLIEMMVIISAHHLMNDPKLWKLFSSPLKDLFQFLNFSFCGVSQVVREYLRWGNAVLQDSFIDGEVKIIKSRQQNLPDDFLFSLFKLF